MHLSVKCDAKYKISTDIFHLLKTNIELFLIVLLFNLFSWSSHDSRLFSHPAWEASESTKKGRAGQNRFWHNKRTEVGYYLKINHLTWVITRRSWTFIKCLCEFVYSFTLTELDTRDSTSDETFIGERLTECHFVVNI